VKYGKFTPISLGCSLVAISSAEKDFMALRKQSGKLCQGIPENMHPQPGQSM